MTSERLTVSDTGPLITLERLSDGYRFIRTLYDTILIPRAVLSELVQGQFVSADASLTHYQVADLFEIVDVPLSPELSELSHLDRGEQETIQLSHLRRLPLLIEEEAGRRVAQSMGISLSGIAGQIFRAYHLGIVSSGEATDKLQELRDAGRINSRIHQGLLAAIRKTER